MLRWMLLVLAGFFLQAARAAPEYFHQKTVDTIGSGLLENTRRQEDISKNSLAYALYRSQLDPGRPVSYFRRSYFPPWSFPEYYDDYQAFECCPFYEYTTSVCPPGCYEIPDDHPPEDTSEEGDDSIGERCDLQVPGWTKMSDGRQIYLGEVHDPTKKPPLSWYKADAIAMEKGARLAEVKSPEDTEVLQTFKNCYPDGIHLWIGGNDLAMTGRWVWSKGDEIAGYDNWAAVGSGEKGHCLEVRYPQSNEGQEKLNEWHASECAGGLDDFRGPRAYLLEREHFTSPPTSTDHATKVTTTTTTTTTTLQTNGLTPEVTPPPPE